MGGLLHFFDFNESSMAKKFLTRKKHNGGLEAPRNSLDLPVETSQSYYAAGDSVLLSYQVDRDLCQNKYYPSEASMKKLIDEEIYKRRNTRQNTPSVVARLMGMDMLPSPSDTKLVDQAIEKKNVNMKNSLLKQDRLRKGTIGDAPFESNSSTQLSFDLFHHNKDSGPDSSSLKLGKAGRREHPQEEELQNFKKEFEAWQAAKFKECSRVAEVGNIPRQFLAQEYLNKEKMAFYATSGETATEKQVEVKAHTIKANSLERGNLQHQECKKNTSPLERRESFPLRSKITNRDLEQFPLISDQKLDKSFAPTRIVILKPGPDKIGNYEESWTCSSSTLKEKDSIEDFLEEVKERLNELQGKTSKRSTVARGGGTETPFSEYPSHPKQIAHQIAKQVRENVTRDLAMNLPRSESTRSYSSETQFNGPGSPEFINKDTRRFLSERLRNVLKNDTHMDNPVSVSGSSGSSSLDIDCGRFEQTVDIFKDRARVHYWENARDGPEIQTQSFRHGPDDDGMLHIELSSRNLIRSLSAPVSGTSFGKLLLEDRHVLTGAHIRRKHEDIKHVSVNVKKQKKERFSIRQKVSNIRYSFTLRRKLLHKRIQSVTELPIIKHDPMKDIMSGPTVIMNFGDRPDNSTEVPPSPASVCSSLSEEFWRPAGCLSPISTADVRSIEDDTIPQAFREINSNLNELRRQLNQLESNEFEDTAIKEPSSDDMIELEDPAEAYIRDLLVASGLYDGSSDRSFSRWDPLAKPICKKVFEEVEESYRNMTKEDEGSKDDQSKKKVDHKVLLDLLNEAIATVLGPPVTITKFRRKIIGTSMFPLPRGRKLLNLLWEIICIHVYPPTDKSCFLLDNMVARDLGSTPWSGLIDADTNEMGREIECRIIGDLIEEIVKDMML